jgi:hypothetical protein
VRAGARSRIGLGAAILLAVGSAHLRSDAQAVSTAPVVVCRPDRPTAETGDALAVQVSIDPSELEGLQYVWEAQAGVLRGAGAAVTWELAAVRPSPVPYTATVRVTRESAPVGQCSLRIFVRPRVADPGAFRGGPETARAMLPAGQAERSGYGLYSYLLLGSRPTEGSRVRYQRTFAAFFELVPHVAQLERYVDRGELNMAYVPATDSAPEDGVTPEWALAHYDYVRALALLRRLPGALRDGPYLVSALRPLSGGDAPTRYLFQDLSAVPPDLAALWIKEFLNQAAQENFWEPRSAANVALRLRTTVGQLAVGMPKVQEAMRALGLPDVKAAMERWIAWRS